MEEIGEKRSKKQEQFNALIHNKSLNEALLMETNRKILEFRKFESLRDIFFNFMDADALDKGIAAIKNIILEESCTVYVTNNKMNLLTTLHIIEGILQEKVWEDIDAQNLHCLILNKIRYELKISDITKELNESFGKSLDVIVKQLNEFSYSDI